MILFLDLRHMFFKHGGIVTNGAKTKVILVKHDKFDCQQQILHYEGYTNLMLSTCCTRHSLYLCFTNMSMCIGMSRRKRF